MTTQSRNTGTLTSQTKHNVNLTWDAATFTWASADTQTWDVQSSGTSQTRNTGSLTSQIKH